MICLLVRRWPSMPFEPWEDLCVSCGNYTTPSIKCTLSYFTSIYDVGVLLVEQLFFCWVCMVPGTWHMAHGLRVGALEHD